MQSLSASTDSVNLAALYSIQLQHFAAPETNTANSTATWSDCAPACLVIVAHYTVGKSGEDEAAFVTTQIQIPWP